MAEHFSHGAAMRDAIIAGQLDRMKNEAVWMAEHEVTPDLAASWQPFMRRMQEAARQARDATNLEQGARAVADMAVACGSCHRSLGGPHLAVGEPPSADASGAVPHMLRHQWAAQRLWDGLIGPSDDAWVRGAEAMANAPLEPAALTGNRGVDPRTIERLARRVHRQAEMARSVRDPALRARAYGEVLATCADCHRASGALEPRVQ